MQNVTLGFGETLATGIAFLVLTSLATVMKTKTVPDVMIMVMAVWMNDGEQGRHTHTHTLTQEQKDQIELFRSEP